MGAPKGYGSVKRLRGRASDKRHGNVRRPDDLIRTESTLAGCLDAYIDRLSMLNHAETTKKTRRHHLYNFVVWCDQRGLLYPGEITRSILESYQRHLYHHRKKNGKPLGMSTQRYVLVSIKQFFSWLCRRRILEANPASEIDLPKRAIMLPADILSVSEVEAWLAVPDITDPLGIRDRAILELFYSTGIRRAELTRLEVGSLNRENLTLFIHQGKGQKDRMVPVGRRALAWVERYCERSRPLLLVNPRERALFLTAYGEPFSPSSLGHKVHQYLVRADIGRTKGGCHLLRHACASHMLEGGADIRYIQQLLGHANLDTTAVYTQVAIRQLQSIHANTHPAEKAAALSADLP